LGVEVTGGRTHVVVKALDKTTGKTMEKRRKKKENRKEEYAKKKNCFRIRKEGEVLGKRKG